MSLTWRAEPVAIAAVISAGVKLLVLFGVDLTPEQQAGILLFTDALLAAFVRHGVTPTQKKD